MSQKDFAEYFNVPVRTLQDWEHGKRTPPEYVVELIKYKIEKEGMQMTKLDVHWEFDGKQYKGTVEFKKQGNETFISFSNENGHVIENGTVSAEVAEDIRNEIVARNCDMTDFEIF